MDTDVPLTRNAQKMLEEWRGWFFLPNRKPPPRRALVNALISQFSGDREALMKIDFNWKAELPSSFSTEEIKLSKDSHERLTKLSGEVMDHAPAGKFLDRLLTFFALPVNSGVLRSTLRDHVIDSHYVTLPDKIALDLPLHLLPASLAKPIPDDEIAIAGTSMVTRLSPLTEKEVRKELSKAKSELASERKGTNLHFQFIVLKVPADFKSLLTRALLLDQSPGNEMTFGSHVVAYLLKTLKELEKVS
jgi:hypothetical protein